MKRILFTALFVALVSSCSLQMKSSKSMDLDPQAVVYYQAYDLVVSETPVSGSTDSMTSAAYLKAPRSTCESFAIANALEKVGADVLVEPKFTYTYNNFGRLKRVTVTGYPAKYKNFHKASKEEIDPLYPEYIPVSEVKPVVVLPSSPRR